jgi:hypothetical protein
MQIIKTIATIAFVSIVLVPLKSQTLAQQTPAQQPAAQQPPGQQPDLNETQLRSFAKVYVQVEKILKIYEPQLKDAKTPEEGKQIQNEEMSKVNQALTQEGMDAQSYHRIIEIANGDDGLRKKLLGFINEERQKS